jgi:transcriptional regulator with XRE-family HTH domain
MNMTRSAKKRPPSESEPVRVLGRGLGARRGVQLTLRSLRDAAGKTQVDVAEQSQINQADVSRLENRKNFDDCQVATLKRYLEAVGAELELVARFGDRRITIATAQSVATPANSGLNSTGKRSGR